MSANKGSLGAVSFFLLGFFSLSNRLEPLWNMAEKVGFEPTVSITPRPISNRVP